MNNLPVDRALSIYAAVADRSEARTPAIGCRNSSRREFAEGEKDEHRLTVEGLSFLQKFYREIDTRT